MTLAEFNLIEHINDHPWYVWHPWGPDKMGITLMSSGIASMILVAIFLIAFVVPLARRKMSVPKGGTNILEIIVVFVNDMIATPALHDKGYRFLPFLCTQFVFFLGLNLLGLIPLSQISTWITKSAIGKAYPIGFTATSILTVTGAQATLVLLMILFFSFKRQAEMFCEHHKNVSMAFAIVISPLLFLKSLVPHVPGKAGIFLWPMLLVLEFTSVFTRCAALMIRLFANMLAGHSLLAVFMMFILTALETQLIKLLYIGPVCILASVGVSLLELLVASLQAYIFTFLTAIFLGLYMEPEH